VSRGEAFTSVLAAARVGAEWAWTDIYRGLAPQLLRYFRARGANEPQDLVAEVFVQLVRRIGHFEGNEDGFRGWVFAIAHGRYVDEVRRTARRPAEAMEAGFIELLGPVGDAETDAWVPLGHHHVIEILRRLSRDQQDVLYLRMIAGLSLEEAGHVLGKTTGAVKSLQARGLASIRREISKEAVSV